MAAQSTALNSYSENGNSRTSYTTGHTMTKPKLVIEKRKIPTTLDGVAEYSFSVVHATEDDDGNIIAQKVAMYATVRMPLQGQTSDRDAVLAIFRDIIAGDEFGVSVGSAGWLT
jgi:hypothetical protein